MLDLSSVSWFALEFYSFTFWSHHTFKKWRFGNLFWKRQCGHWHRFGEPRELIIQIDFWSCWYRVSVNSSYTIDIEIIIIINTSMGFPTEMVVVSPPATGGLGAELWHTPKYLINKYQKLRNEHSCIIYWKNNVYIATEHQDSTSSVPTRHQQNTNRVPAKRPSQSGLAHRWRGRIGAAAAGTLLVLCWYSVGILLVFWWYLGGMGDGG